MLSEKIYIVEVFYIYLQSKICLDQKEKNPELHNDFYLSHRKFLLRNRVGKTCLWKKYILLYEQGEN